LERFEGLSYGGFWFIEAVKERIYGRPSRKVFLTIVLTALDA
jgi:hypothetical protein